MNISVKQQRIYTSSADMYITGSLDEGASNVIDAVMTGEGNTTGMAVDDMADPSSSVVLDM